MSWSCGDGPAVYGEEERVARKQYGCVECCAPILPGERYLSYRGMWDGDWGGGRQHLLCRDACVWARDVMNGECLDFGGLGDYWDNTRSWSEIIPWNRKPTEADEARAKKNWLIGAKMYAMIRRRERIARTSSLSPTPQPGDET